MFHRQKHIPEHKRGFRGLTIIELVVTVAILGSMVSLIAFFIQLGKPAMELYSSSKTLAQTLRTARNLAVTEQVAYGVVFNAANSSYDLVKIPAATVETHTLASSVIYKEDIPFTSDTVTFNSAGTASQEGTILLENETGSQKSVIIKPSGYVEVK